MGEKLEEQEKDEEKQSMVKNDEKEEIENDDNGVKSEGEDKEEKEEKDTLKEDLQDEDEVDEEEEQEEILPPPKVEIKELHSIPDFAAICNFFNKFQLISNMKQMNFGKLETLLTTYENNKAPKELVELHVFLLRRAKFQHTTVDNWERYFTKFLYTNPITEETATRIERYGGYPYIPIVDKILALKVLCETQIDTNVRLRDAITNTFRHIDLRLTPVGTDRYGLSYWYQQDNDCNLRIYTEEPEDHCGSTWTLVASNHEELKTLIENLEKDDLGYNKKLDPLEKQKEADIQKGKIPVGHTDKKGTYFDTYIDIEQINKLKDAVLKVKTEKMNRRMGRPPKVRKFVESEEEEEEKKEVETEEPENEEEPEIPEDLLEDRRPRRGAMLRAASNLKKVLGSGSTPKRTPKKVVEKKASKSESEASENENEDEDDEENEDEETEESDNDPEDSGDEFRPKSEKKKVKKRRGRKARKPVDFDEDDEESNDEEEVKQRKVATGDNACGKCQKSTDWEVLLLCDCCDDAWHTYCLKPVLWYVPDGDWYCPKCKHGRLIDRLKAAEVRFDADLKKKAIDDKKKQAAAERLRREMEYIGVSFNNIIQNQQLIIPQPVASSSESDDDGTQRKCKRKAVKKMTNWNKPKPQYTAPVFVGGRRSCRSRTKVDYKGSEFDQMIEEAVDNIDGAPPREVKPPREPELDENGEPKPKVGRGRKKARLNDLDAVVDSDGSNNYEEEQEESASEEEDEEAEIDSGSDFEDELPKTSKHRSRRSYVRRGGSGKGRGRRKRSWSGSSTGEEEDDWIASDSDDGYRKDRKRKIQYESDVEEEEDVEKSTTGRPLRKAVKASDGERRKIVISDSDDDNEPEAKKKSKQRGSDDEFEVENDDNEEEEEEEEEEEGDGDEDEDEEEDDDTEGDSNESAPVRDVKRMAGAPPSQQLPVRPIKPQISAKRPRIRPETVKAKTPESDDNAEEEVKKPERKPITQDIPITLPASLFTHGNMPGNFDQMVPNPYLLPPPVPAEPANLPVPNPYANVNTKDDAKQSGAQYLAL